MQKQNIIQNKKHGLKYKLAMAIILALLISALILSWFSHKEKSDSASEKIIRKATARQLNKDPNELTDEDFAHITELNIKRKELYDIKFLEKFTNLKVLSLNYIPFFSSRYSQMDDYHGEAKNY
jgi:hypothetical protein